MCKEIVLDGIELVLIDTESEEITNPYSGQSCILVPEAIALYDYIKGCEVVGNGKGLSKGLSVFVKHWPKEYMILLD
jgi:hypothetical protein